jgi:predicted enzyme related to lactoylglutathione lyase
MGVKMSDRTNALNWFEIPAVDLQRAMKFYETAFEIKMNAVEMAGMEMAMFPPDGSEGRVGGALVKGQMHVPSSTGAIIYLNGNPDLQTVLDRIPGAGGKVIMQKTLIDENSGYFAFFTDSEGNTVGVHSNG